MDDQSQEKDQYYDFKKTMAKAGPDAAAQLLAGIFAAQRELELEKQKTQRETAKNISDVKSKDISFGTQSQINPLKALIANYRASIK